MKEKAIYLLKSTRPLLNMVLVLGVFMGLIKSGGLTLGNVIFSSVFIFFHGFAVFSLNDYFDRDTDQFSSSSYLKGVTPEEEKRDQLLYSAIVSMIAILLMGALVSGTVLLVSLGVVTLSILYSVPPFRFKSRPPLDSLVNGLGILALFVLGLALGSKNFSVPVEAYWMAAFAAGAHVLASLPDIEYDRKAGLRTTGMILGWRKSIMLNIALVTVSFYFVNWGMITLVSLSIFMINLFYLLLYPDSEHFYRGIKIMLPVAVLYGLTWILVSVI